MGLGDHRALILDVSTRSLVGLNPQPIKHPTARRLNTKIPHCADQYNDILERQVIYHKLIPKLNEAYQCGGTPETLQAKLDAIDQTSTQLMKNAEKQCRKLKSG
jgi:hypothetical protein